MEFDRLRRFALSLPEAVEAPHFDYASFRVGGRIFATVPPDRAHAHVFVGEDQREPALAPHPGFLEKLPRGRRIVGLWIALAKADPAVVEALLRHAWGREGAEAFDERLMPSARHAGR